MQELDQYEGVEERVWDTEVVVVGDGGGVWNKIKRDLGCDCDER